jgi:hypothetical protein
LNIFKEIVIFDENSVFVGAFVGGQDGRGAAFSPHPPQWMTHL